MMLEKVISDLVLRHACVIVPDFGGFISQRVPATIDYKSGKVLPPSKSVLFNRQLLSSDGLLIGAYANQQAIAYDEAVRQIKEIVANWKTQLRNGQRVAIDTIGYLYQDNSGQVCFEQDKFVNLLLSSYGLSTLTISMDKEEQKVLAEEANTIEFIDFNTATVSEKVKAPIATEVSEDKVVKTKLHWTRYVAAAALLPVVFYSFWIPVKTDFLQSGVLSINDFNPFYKKTEVLAETPTTSVEETTTKEMESIDSEVVEEVLVYEMDENTQEAALKETVAIPEEKAAKISITNYSQANFYVIGNCFGVVENAENFVQSMQSEGLSAEIVDQVNGLYRVAIGKANSSEELEQVKQEVLAKGISNFWILKK